MKIEGFAGGGNLNLTLTRVVFELNSHMNMCFIVIFNFNKSCI